MTLPYEKANELVVDSVRDAREEAMEKALQVGVTLGIPEMRETKRNNIACPAPGIYNNFTMTEYHRIDAFNASTGKKFMESGLHGASYLNGEQGPPTPDMLLGTAFHSALFEPEDYLERKVVGKYQGKPLADKCAYSSHAKAEKDNPGKIILHAGWEEAIENSVMSVLRHPFGGKLFRDPDMVREVTLIWHEPIKMGERVYTVPCKARLDAFSPLSQCIPDAKFTGDIDPRNFVFNAWKLGYHRSGGLYAHACWRLNLLRKDEFGRMPESPYLMMGVSRKPINEGSEEHLCALYAYDNESLDQGLDELLTIGATRYLLYRMTGYAEGPSYTLGVNSASIPQFDMNTDHIARPVGSEPN